MAITEVKKNIDISKANIQFICPVCKTKKSLEVPKSVIEEAKQLTTMSIARGLVCEHQFQAFVDKNYQVRGYQKVDFEIEHEVNQEKSSNSSKMVFNNDDELFNNLVLEGNYVEYSPKKTKSKRNRQFNSQDISTKDKKMTLKEIYDEFWELIDRDNEKFKEFILNDVRRS